MEIRKGWTIVIVEIVVSLIIGISTAIAETDYPSRNINLVVPMAPGGATDSILRLYKDKVEKRLGQPTVMIYKPGAGGVIASTYVKESKPDGYTLLAISSNTMILGKLTRKADYSLDDFIPVCSLALSPAIFCVKADSPYKTIKDFFQAAKTKKLKYSTTGSYQLPQLIIEAIGKKEGLQAIAVPMNGAAQAMTAVLGGHVDMSASSPTGIEDQLRILAVLLKDRWAAQPSVPTLKELGYPYEFEIYYSIFAPKGTPKKIVDEIYGAYKEALKENSEEIIKRAKGIRAIPRVLNPEEMGKLFREQTDFCVNLLSDSGALVK